MANDTPNLNTGNSTVVPKTGSTPDAGLNMTSQQIAEHMGQNSNAGIQRYGGNNSTLPGLQGGGGNTQDEVWADSESFEEPDPLIDPIYNATIPGTVIDDSGEVLPGTGPTFGDVKPAAGFDIGNVFGSPTVNQASAELDDQNTPPPGNDIIKEYENYMYRGQRTTDSIKQEGGNPDFFRVNEKGEYVDGKGVKRTDGWVPAIGKAPDPPKGDNFYFKPFGELNTGKTGSAKDETKAWYDPSVSVTPTELDHYAKTSDTKFKNNQGGTYFADIKGSGMYVQNLKNKQSKDQIQKQLNKQKAERAYNSITKEWTFDYLRSSGDKKKNKAQAKMWYDNKIKHMKNWGPGLSGDLGFGGVTTSNMKDLKNRFEKAYGTMGDPTATGMINRGLGGPAGGVNNKGPGWLGSPLDSNRGVKYTYDKFGNLVRVK
jgi:hypothetical protein